MPKKKLYYLYVIQYYMKTCTNEIILVSYTYTYLQ